MPYEYDPENDDENQNGAPPPPPAVPSGNRPASTAESGQTPFVNLQKYLQVNDDQTAGLAERVANPIETQAQSARDKAGQAQGSFQQQVQQNTASMPTFLDQVGQNAAGLSDEQKNEIKQKRSASYSGPSSIEETGLLEGSYADQQKAKERADLSKTNQGRFSLLQDLVGSPSYKKGETRLDQALLSGSQAAQTRLGQAQSKVGEAEGDIQSKITASNALVDPARQTTDATRSAVNQTLDSSVASRLGQLQNAATAKSQSEAQKSSKILEDLKAGGIGYHDARDMNISSADIFGNTYGVDPSQFYSQGDSQFDINDVADPEQRAQLAALQDLQGREQGYLSDASPNAARGFNLAGYKGAIAAQKAAKSAEVADGIKNIVKSSGIKTMNAEQARRSDASGAKNSKTQEVMPGVFVTSALKPSQIQKLKNQYQSLMQTLGQKYSGQFDRR